MNECLQIGLLIFTIFTVTVLLLVALGWWKTLKEWLRSRREIREAYSDYRDQVNFGDYYYGDEDDLSRKKRASSGAGDLLVTLTAGLVLWLRYFAAQVRRLFDEGIEKPQKGGAIPSLLRVLAVTWLLVAIECLIAWAAAFFGDELTITEAWVYLYGKPLLAVLSLALGVFLFASVIMTNGIHPRRTAGR